MDRKAIIAGLIQESNGQVNCPDQEKGCEGCALVTICSMLDDVSDEMLLMYGSIKIETDIKTVA